MPDAQAWEHVSVHARRRLQSRIPTWREMCHVKDLFWDPDDLVLQFHPRRADYVNQHEHVLHLWRYRLAGLRDAADRARLMHRCPMVRRTVRLRRMAARR